MTTPRSRRGPIRVAFVGAGKMARLHLRALRRVAALGAVPDLPPVLAEACCCVVPIRIGGGTRLKIPDAWAMGKAVVSTSIGCEGLEELLGRSASPAVRPHHPRENAAGALSRC